MHRRWDRQRITGLITSLPPPLPLTPTCFRLHARPVNAGHQFHFVSRRERFRDSFPSRLSRHSLPSVPLKGAKKKTDDFTFALQTLQPVPEILHEHSRLIVLAKREGRYFRGNTRGIMATSVHRSVEFKNVHIQVLNFNDVCTDTQYTTTE